MQTTCLDAKILIMALPKNRGDREYFWFFQDNVAYTDPDGTAIAIGTFVGGKYVSSAPTYTDGDPVVLRFTSDGKLMTDGTFSIEGDINIGSVELKDAGTDTRAKVKSDGTDNALVVTMNSLPAQTPVLQEGDNVVGRIKVVDEAGTNVADVDGGRLKVSVHDENGSITVDNAGTFAVQSDTELPAAGALGDAMDNPTTPLVGACLMGWDSAATKWERCKTDASNYLKVDASVATVTVTGDSAGSLTVDQGTHDNFVCNANIQQGDTDVASDNELYVRGSGTAGTADAAVLTIQGIASMTPVIVDLGTNNDVSLNAGSNKVGDVGLLGNTAADGSGTDYHALIDTAGHFQIDVVSMPSVTVDSEFPAAAAATDAIANPTTTNVMSMLMGWDSTNSHWERVLLAESLSNSDAGDSVVLKNYNNDETGILPTLIMGYDNTVNDNAYRALAVNASSQLEVSLAASSATVTVDLGANNDVTVTSGSITADTEMPAAAALDDSTGNPTTPVVGACLMGYDGTNWERVKTDTDNRLLIAGGGTAGTADDAVVTVQGVASMTPVIVTGDSAGSLTVDGTVTANLSATDNTVLDNIDSNTDYGAVVGGGTEATALRVTVANDSTGLVTVDNTSIDGPGAPTIDSYQHIAINLTTGDNQVLVASDASKQIWVYGYGFTVGDADGQTVSLQDEDDNAVTGIMEFAQYGGISVPPSGNFAMPVFKLATDKDLEVDITGGDVDGWLCYAIVSV